MPGFRWGAKSGVVSALGWVLGSLVPGAKGTDRQVVCGSGAFSPMLVVGGKVVSNFGDSQACSAGVLMTGPRTPPPPPL